MSFWSVSARLQDERDIGGEEKEIENIRSLMTTLKFTAQQAMDALQVPLEKREWYMSKL